MRVRAVFLFLFFSLTNAFIVPIQRTHPAINKFATCHYGTSDKDEQVDNIIPSNNDDNNNGDGERKPLTTRRIGGRSSAEPSRDEPRRRGWLFLAVPVVAVWLLFQNLFGGPSDFVYYESSVYESRVIGEGGKVETARKESVRTNIPGLVEGRGKDEQRMLRQSDDFDRAMDRELKNMFDDFF